MELVSKLTNEPDERLQTLKEIKAKILGKSDTVMISNIKKLILALKSSLQPCASVSHNG